MPINAPLMFYFVNVYPEVKQVPGMYGTFDLAAVE